MWMRLHIPIIIVSLLCISGTRVIAQQEVSVTVQVNRLPTGTYPTKLYQFSSTPGLVNVMLTNHTSATYNLYLNGSLTGDNGVQISTAKGYQPATLTLNPFEVKSLNAVEAGSLFDPNSLVYLSGNSSIKPSVYGEQGLPEGTYQVCIKAFDAATHKSLSADEPIGCSNIFTISTLEPPTILNPVDADSLPSSSIQNISFRWTTPPGAPPSTQYKITLVEIFDNRNPNDAILSTPTPFFETTVLGTPIFLYSMQYPRLVDGRKYAMQVTAFDPSGVATFRNLGKSEAIMFQYGQPPSAAVDYITLAARGPQACSADCMASLSDTRPRTDLSGIQAGSVLSIDGFHLTVTSISGNQNGLLSGEGTIPVPVLQGLPVDVTFQGVQLNSGNQVIAGTAVARRRADAAALLPDYDPANPNRVIDPGNAQTFAQYIASNTTGNSAPSQAGGYSLPLGVLPSGGGSNPIIIAITNLQFTPVQASLDAAATVEIPEAGMTAALGGRSICFSADKGFCGQGLVFLEQPLDLGRTNLSLKVSDGTDPGTFIEFGTAGFSRLRIRGEFTFPINQLLTKAGAPLKAQLTVESAQSWADWIAAVTFDPFQMAGNGDFSFYPGTAFYDHSDLRNPDGMPSDYAEGIQPTWRGFLISSLQVGLPGIIKSFADNSQQIANAQSFVIDNLGLSGDFAMDNLLPIDQGSLGTWQYSVDHIEGRIVKNSFASGNMIGKVLLPIANDSDPNSLLDYTCTLNSGPAPAPANAAPGANGFNNGTVTAYQFAIQAKDNVDVPMWWVHMNVDKSSYVSVSVNQGVFQPVARLNGSITLKPNLGSPLDKVQITAITFQSLVLNSVQPYIGDGQLTMSQSIPVGFMNGLPVSFSQPPAFTPNKLGLQFSIDITLADVAIIPKAHTTFSILGGLDLVGGRLKARVPTLQVDQIGLDGWVGPVKVAGYVKFFDGDPKFGDGVEGVLQEATFPPGFTVKATALFGKQNYNYFFVGASLDLPPPAIPIGGGVIPLSIFGFGGGVYYNMTLNQEPMMVKSINETDPMSMYTPQAGITGFKGSMTLGSSDGHVLVAAGTLSVEIDQQTLAIHKMAVNIDGAMYTALLDMDNALVKGSGFIQYDFSQDELSAGISTDIKLTDNLSGSATLGILANATTGEWYFKMGEADPNGSKITMKLSAFDLVSFIFKGYQNIGNRLILPPYIQSVYDAVAGQMVATDPNYTNPQTQQTVPVQKLGGVLLGASVGASVDLDFLIFYLSMSGTVGFDLALLSNTGKCDNGALAGINGYYAVGDLYANGKFDFGLILDLWFYKGKIKANLVSIGFNATMSGGFPNPFVFNGWLGADYSVLDGAVSGHMNFHVNYSSAGDAGCKLVTNPFGGMPLVSAVYPADGDENISIMSDLNVAFNFPVNQEFQVTVHDDNTGQDVTKSLLVVVKKLGVTEAGGSGYSYDGYMNEDGSSTTDGGANIQAVYHNALLYGWQNAFDPQTMHTIKLTVYGFQRDANGNWQEVTEARIQDSTLHFKTGDCITRLDAGVSLGEGDGNSLVTGSPACASYPFPYQRYFLPGQRSKGYVQVVHMIPCLQSPPTNPSPLQLRYSSVQVTGYNLIAQFVSATDIFESPIQQVGKMFEFDIPALSPSTVYKLRLLKRPIYRNSGPDLNSYLSALRQGVSPANTRPLALAGDPESGAMKNFVNIKNYTADSTESIKHPDDIEIYLNWFKTSRYQTLQDKFSGSFQTGSVTWNLLMPFFQVSLLEGLDTYDANGYAYDGSGIGTNNWIIPPLVNLDERYADNPWMQNVINPLVASYSLISPFDPEAAFNNLWQLNSPAGNTGYQLSIPHTYVADRMPFVITGYEQPLSQVEIPLALRIAGMPGFVVPNVAGVMAPAASPMVTTPPFIITTPIK